MRSRVLLAVPALAVVALAVTGCSQPVAPEPSAPAPSAPTGPLAASTGTVGSDGLTVRYLEGGTVKTVRVEDFPR